MIRPAATVPKRSRLREIERVWMGLTTLPLQERLAEAGWRPESPASYCERCGATVGPHDADDTGCSTCRGGKLPWERLIRLGEFEGLLRELVHEVKFTRWRRLGDDLGRLLGRAIGEIAATEGLNPADIVLIPAPASFRRRMVRGIDHALVIARGTAAELGCDVVRALQRRHRPSQTSLPHSRRASNVAGAFRFRVGCLNRVMGRTVVVLDDVTTTRATLRAACGEVRRGLKAAGGGTAGVPARVWAAVLAVTPDPASRGPGGGRNRGGEAVGDSRGLGGES